MSLTALRDFCASFEQAIADTITEKAIRAAQQYNVRTITLSGGVSANTRLREHLAIHIKKRLPKTTFITPSPEFSTDNAAMIAAAAFFTKNNARSWKGLDADAQAPLEKQHSPKSRRP